MSGAQLPKKGISPDIYRKVAEYAIHLDTPTRGKYLRAIAKKLNISLKTVYRGIERFGDFSSGRKVRKDAFKLTEETESHTRLIAKIYHEKISKDSKYSLKYAIADYLQMFDRKEEPRPELPHISTIHQYLNRLGLSRKQVKAASPHIRLRSLYPNHVWSLDFTVTYCLLEENSNRVISFYSQDANKNKPELLNSPNRLVCMAFEDHASGAVIPKYFRRQQMIDIARFMFFAMSKKKDPAFPVHGIPEVVLMDNDKALRSYAMLALFRELGTDIPAIRPYKARAKGGIEKGIDLWQRFFEPKLRLIKNDSGPVTLEMINESAFQYAIEWNANEIHSRHGKTRFDCWYEYIENHLREIPSQEIYEQMLTRKPVPAKVNGAGDFLFNGEKYYVAGIYDSYVDVIIQPFRYEKDKAVIIQYPSQTKSQVNIKRDKIQTITVIPGQSDHLGFPSHAVTVGTYKALPETLTQKNLKIQDKLELDYDLLNPLKALHDNKKIYMPVTGTPLQVTPAVTAGPVVYTKLDAKDLIHNTLRRPLSKHELEIINEKYLGNLTLTDKEVESLISQFQSPASLPEAAEGGNK
jgi:hypothetical protein